MRFDIITIFPKMFECYFKESIIKRAAKRGLIKIKIHNLRDFTRDRHKSIDDRPYGGGAGMIFKVEPLAKAVSFILKKNKIPRKKTKIILFSPKGKLFHQTEAARFAKYKNIIMICPRYEGVDERVLKYIADEEISIGEYVLTGGEIPAIILTDAVARLVPGVIKPKSLNEESFCRKNKDFFEPPQYTRPEIFDSSGLFKFKKLSPKKWKTPKELLSGDPEKIVRWKLKFSQKNSNKRAS